MELLKMNSKQILELTRNEIRELVNIKTTVLEEIEFYDNNIKEVVKEQVNSYDLISKYKVVKEELEAEKTMVSDVYMFKLNKIESYNDLIDFRIERNRKFVKHNEKYDYYKKEISQVFNENNKNGKLKEFLQIKNIKITLEFYVNYTQKDIDNITKPFIDCLFYNVDTDDNNIKEINSKILKSSNKSEYILIKIESIKKIDIYSSSMLKEYNKNLSINA